MPLPDNYFDLVNNQKRSENRLTPSTGIYRDLTPDVQTPQGGNALYFKLFRGSTEIGSGSGGDYYNVAGALTNPSGHTTDAFDVKGFSIQHLDSPSTTSATTYKLHAAATNGTAKIGGRQDNNDIAVPSRITLMEISQ